MYLPYNAAGPGDIQLTFHDGELTDGKSELRGVESGEDEEEDGLSIHNTLPQPAQTLASAAPHLPPLAHLSTLSAELKLDPTLIDDGPAGSVMLFSYSQPTTPDGVKSPSDSLDVISPAELASPADLPPPSPFSPLPLLPSIASPPVQSPDMLSPLQSPTSAGSAGHEFFAVAEERPHRFSIVVDSARPLFALPAMDEKDDDGGEMNEYDDEQPGSLPHSPQQTVVGALPPPSPISHHLSSDLSPQPHSASFSFSYQSDDSDDESPLPPSVVPPKGLADRYDAVEPHTRQEAEALAALRREKEEEAQDAELDEDDIGKVISYHTVRNPEAADSIHFEHNPLHVINIRSDEERAAEERRQWEQAMEQKRKEKEERRARRVEKRRRRAEREAQLQQQHTSSVLVIEEESAADVEEEEQKQGIPARATQLGRVAACVASYGRQRSDRRERREGGDGHSTTAERRHGSQANTLRRQQSRRQQAAHRPTCSRRQEIPPRVTSTRQTQHSST